MLAELILRVVAHRRRSIFTTIVMDRPARGHGHEEKYGGTKVKDGGNLISRFIGPTKLATKIKTYIGCRGL